MFRRVFLLLVPLALAACATSTPPPSAGQIAIYLPLEPLSGRDILAADLPQLKLQPQPLVPADEIISYAASTHDLILAPAALDRLVKLKVPMNGLGFAICQGARTLFVGAFWTPLSSISFDGLTMQVMPGISDSQVHLYSGYPGMDAPLPNDPRDDPRLLEALQQEGKLR